MLKQFFHKNYLIYGSSIIVGRGLEYIVLFFAAHYMSKNDYGELEYYRKIIEVGAFVFSFGFPALILSYTKSRDSKVYFFLFSAIFTFGLGVISTIFLGYFNWLFLIIPFVFYGTFFNGSTIQSYFLVRYGSNYVSVYKTIVSLLYYGLIFCSIYFFDVTGYAYVYVNYALLPILVLFSIRLLYREQLIWHKAKRYWTLFKKLIFSSLTLVLSNFTNLMFLATDIFIIKLLSQTANVEIANYGFSLNIANMLLLIPLTLVQVDIEKLKKNYHFASVINKRIVILTAVAVLVLIALFYTITTFYITDYRQTFSLFLVILTAKIFQVLSPLYGTMIVILKKYNINLYINLVALILNISLSYLLYEGFGIFGVAFASVTALVIRYILFYTFYKKALQKLTLK